MQRSLTLPIILKEIFGYDVYTVTPLRIYESINHMIVCPHYNHLLFSHHLQKTSLDLKKAKLKPTAHTALHWKSSPISNHNYYSMNSLSADTIFYTTAYGMQNVV